MAEVKLRVLKLPVLPVMVAPEMVGLVKVPSTVKEFRLEVMLEETRSTSEED